MTTPAIITLLVAVVLIWGGMAASIAHAVRVSRRDD